MNTHSQTQVLSCTCLCLLVCAAAFAGEPAADLAADTDKIARVAAGELTEARASWWGFDAEDATESLQAALDSGVKRLVIDRMDTPWLVRPLHVTCDDMEIVLEADAVIEAKPGAYAHKRDCLLTIKNRENVTLRGEGTGATLRMQREDYIGDDYEHGEHRHGLNILSSREIRIENLSIVDSGGDGIYIGTAYSRDPCRKITIRNVVCDRNHRQGISVISVDGLLIVNCSLTNTRGTPPQCGIDFEPNHEYQVLKDIRMRNCRMTGNAGAGATLYLPKLTSASEAISVTLENCISEGNTAGLSITCNASAPDDVVSGKVLVKNCILAGSDKDVLTIGPKAAAGPQMHLSNCVIRSERPGLSPVAFRATAESAIALGGVHFENCAIEVPADTAPVEFRDEHGDQRLVDVSGTLAVMRGGETETLAFDETFLDSLKPDRVTFPDVPLVGREWKPLEPLKPIEGERMPYSLGSFSVRRSGMLAIYAEAGDEVRLRAEHQQAGSRKSETAELAALAPDGEEIPLGRVPFKTERTLTMTAPKTGLYRVPLYLGMGVLGEVRCNRPVFWTTAGREYLHLFRHRGREDSSVGALHFFVPEGTERFAVLFSPRGMERLGATIYAPGGEAMWSEDTISENRQAILEPTPAQAGRPWRVEIRPPAEGVMEDAYLRLQNVPPLLATDPAWLVVPRE